MFVRRFRPVNQIFKPYIPSSTLHTNYTVLLKHRVKPKVWEPEYRQKPYYERDSTPHLFNSHNLSRRDFLLWMDVPNLLARRMPEVPLIDLRKVKNEYWIKRYKRPKFIIKAFRHLRLHDAFIDFEILDEGKGGTILRQMEKNLSINLRVSYGGKQDYYWDSALLGNFLEAFMTEKKPFVTFPIDSQPNAKPDDLYCLIMVTPDYPFRLMPDKKLFAHWIVANIPIREGRTLATADDGDEILKYLPAIPTNHAGTFRYVFQLYKQNGRIDTSSARALFTNTKPEENKKIKISFKKRRNFDLNEFITLHNLEQYPRGMCMFRSVYDESVSETYKKIGIPEPEYNPPEFKPKEKPKKKKNHLFEQWI